jgi:chromate reductase, NAD(P)H dehydrogenase (quinone)
VTTIVGLAGSLRLGSFNSALLRAARELTPEGATVEIGSIRDIPLYDGDLQDSSGVPPVVADLKERIAAASGLLLVTPEYNHAMPGVFKNVIDWLSRPPGDVRRVFGDRPIALMGATTGRGGTILAQASWLPVLRALGTRPWFGGRLTISGADRVFDAQGELVDEAIRTQLRTFMAGFVEFIERSA